MILRLLLFTDCNRNCPGCCNLDWDLSQLSKITEFGSYKMILLTGGEPMLYPPQCTKFAGHGSGMRKDDYIILNGRDGSAHVSRITEVEYKTCPPDQWFADVEIIGITEASLKEFCAATGARAAVQFHPFLFDPGESELQHEDKV